MDAIVSFWLLLASYFIFNCASHVFRDAARSIRLNLSRSTRNCYNYSALPHGSG